MWTIKHKPLRRNTKKRLRSCRELQLLPRCSLRSPGSSAPPSGFWRWSWPCGRDPPGSDPAERQPLKCSREESESGSDGRVSRPRAHLQVPLNLADVVLQQEVVLQSEAAVLVIQLSEEVVETDGGQRVLHGHRVPEETTLSLEVTWTIKMKR